MRPTPALLLICALALTTASASARTAKQPPESRSSRPDIAIPQLGEEVPQPLLKKASARKPCDVGNGHADPCTIVTASRNRVLIAWDAATHRVTYLYTTTLDTDADLRVGDVLAIDPDTPLIPFPGAGQPHRFVSPDWCDTDTDLTGEAEWCAVMVPTHPRSGRVLGFVQSLYLYVPDLDPEPMQRTSAHVQRRPISQGVAE